MQNHLSKVSSAPEKSGSQIAGLEITELKCHQDERGLLMELCRQSWVPGTNFVQWNFTKNKPNVFRGMHMHPSNFDYMVLLEGKMFLGLVDLRQTSKSFGSKALIDVHKSFPIAILIPPGVLHGYFAPDGNSMVIGLSEDWSMSQEFGCRWDDPSLNLKWPKFEAPILSERDRNATTFSKMLTEFRDASSI